MPYTSSEYTSLVSRFEALTLPKTEWTHAAHLAVAVWYVWQHPEEEALDKTRRGIKTYNTAVGTINSDTQGYHETLTRFWVQTVARFMAGQAFATPAAACAALVTAPEGQSTYPLEFYSRERLFSTEARLHWTAPDLKTHLP